MFHRLTCGTFFESGSKRGGIQDQVIFYVIIYLFFLVFSHFIFVNLFLSLPFFLVFSIFNVSFCVPLRKFNFSALLFISSYVCFFVFLYLFICLFLPDMEVRHCSDFISFYFCFFVYFCPSFSVGYFLCLNLFTSFLFSVSLLSNFFPYSLLFSIFFLSLTSSLCFIENHHCRT